MNFSNKNHKHKENNLNNMSKKVILSAVIITGLMFTSCKNESKKETETINTTEVATEMAMTDLSFGVRGNCGMCKKTIEKAANSVEGVKNATWDVDKKKIDVSFDDTKTDVMSIHKAIAASGYDTEKVSGNEEAYTNLAGCCQYDHEMTMNLHSDAAAEDHSGHND